jgi:hypothetical protein
MDGKVRRRRVAEVDETFAIRKWTFLPKTLLGVRFEIDPINLLLLRYEINFLPCTREGCDELWRSDSTCRRWLRRPPTGRRSTSTASSDGARCPRVEGMNASATNGCSFDRETAALREGGSTTMPTYPPPPEPVRNGARIGNATESSILNGAIRYRDTLPEE